MLNKHRRELRRRNRQRLPQRIPLLHLLLLPRLIRLFPLPLHRPAQSLPHPLFSERRHPTVILPLLKIILQPQAILLMLRALTDVPQKPQNRELPIRKHDVAARIELQEQAVLPVRERDLDDPIGAHLAHGRDTAGSQELAQSGDERRRRGGGRARESGQVRAEAGVDDELFAALGFGELEEEDSGGEVVDIGEAEGDELG